MHRRVVRGDIRVEIHMRRNRAKLRNTTTKNKENPTNESNCVINVNDGRLQHYEVESGGPNILKRRGCHGIAYRRLPRVVAQ